MRNRELATKLRELEGRIAQLETINKTQHTDLQRDLGAIHHKLNELSRALDRLLRYAAESTGLEAPDEPTVTWSD